MMNGYVEEEKRKFDQTHQLLAWHACVIANTRGNLKRKDQLTPEKLVKRSKEKKRVMTPEEKRRELQKLMYKIGIDEKGRRK